MSSQEFTDWQAYFSIEPNGYLLEEWRHGSMIAHIVNAVRSTIPLPPGKNIKQFTASDFYPNQKKDDLTPAQREYLEKKKRKRKNG